MSGKNHGMRIGMLVLALLLGACLSLTGCGGSTRSAASGAPSAGSPSTLPGIDNSSAACASFEQAYKTFLAADALKGQMVSAWYGLTGALEKNITSNVSTSDEEVYMTSLQEDAYSIYTGVSEGTILTQGTQTSAGSPFDSDLEKVGNACGTTFTPAKIPV